MYSPMMMDYLDGGVSLLITLKHRNVGEDYLGMVIYNWRHIHCLCRLVVL